MSVFYTDIMYAPMSSMIHARALLLASCVYTYTTHTHTHTHTQADTHTQTQADTHTHRQTDSTLVN